MMASPKVQPLAIRQTAAIKTMRGVMGDVLSL
jgi:hypothetical protein